MVEGEPSRSIDVFVGTTHEKHWCSQIVRLLSTSLLRCHIIPQHGATTHLASDCLDRIFSADRLAQLRGEANKAAADAVRASAGKAAEMTKGSEDVTGPSPGKRARTECQIPNCLTVLEEQVLQDYILSGPGGLLEMSRDTLQLPLNVEATAVAYFKRFYIYNSVMDYHPRDIMHAVLWLACKVEHYPDRFVNPAKVKGANSCKDFKFDSKDFAELGNLGDGSYSISSADLLRLELVVLKALKFHLMVIHSYRAVRGLVESWSDPSGAASSLKAETSQRLLDEAESKIRTWLKTDVPLMYHPAEVALAALKAAVKAVNREGAKAGGSTAKLSLDDFMTRSFPDLKEEQKVRLNDGCKDIEACAKDKRLRGEELKQEGVRIAEKLKLASNPEKERSHPQHQLALDAQREERERIKMLKATRIAEEERAKSQELLGYGAS